jgi:hypothetical protein
MAHSELAIFPERDLIRPLGKTLSISKIRLRTLSLSKKISKDQFGGILLTIKQAQFLLSQKLTVAPRANSSQCKENDE